MKCSLWLFLKQKTLPCSMSKRLHPYVLFNNIICLYISWSSDFTLICPIITITYKMKFAFMPWARDFTMLYEQEALQYCSLSRLLCLPIPWSKDFTPIWSIVLFTFKMHFWMSFTQTSQFWRNYYYFIILFMLEAHI